MGCREGDSEGVMLSSIDSENPRVMETERGSAGLIVPTGVAHDSVAVAQDLVEPPLYRDWMLGMQHDGVGRVHLLELRQAARKKFDTTHWCSGLQCLSLLHVYSHAVVAWRRELVVVAKAHLAMCEFALDLHLCQ